MVLPFDAILIIHLKRAVIRKKNLERHFNSLGGITDKHGNKPIWIYASTGSHPSHRIDNSVKITNKRQRISTSEIGCFESHRQCYSYQIQNQLQTVLILEDDCRITPQAQQVFSEWDKMPEWDYVNFGFTTNRASIVDTHKLATIRPFKNLYEGSGMWLTHAYAINLSTAQLFETETQVQTGGIDWQLTGVQHRIKSYGFQNPSLIKQEPVTFSFPSYIKHTQ
jgi:GR25 family glycosyltransferase involved in LPS biosynthesis